VPGGAVVKHVLIVEDNRVLQSLFAELLADEGMVPTVATTVEEALARLAERTFDSMLLDVRLADGSGALILDALAGAPSAPRVVAMSASPQELAIARQFGVGFITKPFGIDDVLAALSSAKRPIRAS